MTVDEFLKLAASDAVVKAVGTQDGRFCIVVTATGKSSTLVGQKGTRYYPSLNHVADWLQRIGYDQFEVDISLWDGSRPRKARSSTQ